MFSSQERMKCIYGSQWETGHAEQGQNLQMHIAECEDVIPCVFLAWGNMCRQNCMTEESLSTWLFTAKAFTVK